MRYAKCAQISQMQDTSIHRYPVYISNCISYEAEQHVKQEIQCISLINISTKSRKSALDYWASLHASSCYDRSIYSVAFKEETYQLTSSFGCDRVNQHQLQLYLYIMRCMMGCTSKIYVDIIRITCFWGHSTPFFLQNAALITKKYRSDDPCSNKQSAIILYTRSM